MAVMTRANLDLKAIPSCGNPECTNPHCGTLVFGCPGCQALMPVVASYKPGSGLLKLHCVECDGLVAEIAVHPGSSLSFVGELDA